MKEIILLGKLLVRNIALLFNKQKMMIKTTHSHESQSNSSAAQSNRKAQMNSIMVCHTSHHSVYISVEVFQPESPLVVMQWIHISSAKFGLDQRHRTRAALSCHWIEMRKIQTVPKCHFILNSSIMV